MRLQPSLLLIFLCAGSALSQNAAFPLESASIEGSTIPQPIVLEIAGLHLGAPIDKAGIEHACKKLEESGLFSSISYRYAPGPQKGYALTLSVADQNPLVPATIDVPGADENEAWQWLSARFHRFDRQIPQSEGAQKYLAREIEQHFGIRTRGPLTVRMETDLKTRSMTLSFQPEVLPRIQTVSFKGNHAIASTELSSVLNKVVANAEYTERKFVTAVELNLRPVYEEHGFYRVQFIPGSPQLADAGVSTSVAITEGAPYQLGTTEIVGESLLVDAMMSAAKFPKGKLANWKQIQGGIWEMEKVVKRTGFYEATASPERLLDDTAHVLNLRIQVGKGPLYRFGAVRVAGLSPDLEGKARRMWKPKAGDPYDYAYPHEFLQDFSRVVDFRNFRKYDVVTRKGSGDHVMDINLVFEAR